MLKKFLLFFFVCGFFFQTTKAQYDAPLYTSYTTDAARAKMNERLVNNTITKNLALPLTDSTEENWQDAFSAMEVMDFKSEYTETKTQSAFKDIETRSLSFQRALLELAFTNYPGKFFIQTRDLLNKTSDPKIFAMCAEYLIQEIKMTVSKIFCQKN